MIDNSNTKTISEDSVDSNSGTQSDSQSEANQSDHESMYKCSDDDLELIVKMKSIKGCDVLTFGNKEHEGEFYFCSCDPDQNNPICRECKNVCHSGHYVSQAPERLVNICQCGLKNHKIQSEMKNEQVYVSACYFTEIQEKAGLNYFYRINISKQAKNICAFCCTFCLPDFPILQQKSVSLKYSTKLEEIPPCECTHDSHKDIKDIYNCINRLYIGDKKKITLGKLSPVQFVNAMFKTEILLKNIYSSFINYMIKLREEIDASDFEFDPRMNYSSFYRSLQNFSNLSRRAKDLYYFSENVNVFFSKDFMYDILTKKFDVSNHSLWDFKNHYLICFLKMTLCTDLAGLPKLSIDNFENFSPFQRIILTSNARKKVGLVVKYLEGGSAIEGAIGNGNMNGNFIERIMNFMKNFTKLSNSSNCSSECQNLIFTLLHILKKMSKFYFFTQEQKLFYCRIVDDFLLKLSEVHRKKTGLHSGVSFGGGNKVNSIKEDETIIYREKKALNHIIKTLIYFAISYNDQNVLTFLKDGYDSEEVKFFHSKNEIGKNVTKNCINVLNLVRRDHPGKKEEIQDKKSKSILFHCTQLLSLCLNNEDFYGVGLKRDLSNHFEGYWRMVKDSLTERQKLFIEHLDLLTTELERRYMDYFNFNIDMKQLSVTVKFQVTSFFNYINEKEMPDEEDIDQVSGDKSQLIDSSMMSNNFNMSMDKSLQPLKYDTNLNANFNLNIPSSPVKNLKTPDEMNFPRGSRSSISPNMSPGGKSRKNRGKKKKHLKSDEHYRVLMIRSYFVYSLVKFIQIYNQEKMSNKNFIEAEEATIDSILKVLYFFINKTPANAVIVLSTDIISALSAVSIAYIYKVTKLVYDCFVILAEEKHQLAYSYKYVKVVKLLVNRAFVSLF